MYPVRSFRDKMIFCPPFPPGSHFSSHLESRWYFTSYTRPRRTLSSYSCRIFLCMALYPSCFPGPVSSISTACPSYIIHSKVLFIVKNLIRSAVFYQECECSRHRYRCPSSQSPKFLDDLDPHGRTSSNQL